MRTLAMMVAGLIPVLIPGAQSHAYMVYPDRKNPQNLILLIERGTGDLVKFASLPPPFNVARQSAQGPDRFSFRWRYAPGQFGLAYLNVDERGQGVLTIEFTNMGMVDGDSFGAAAVLVSKGGRPLHTFYARADVRDGAFEGETDKQRTRLAIKRPLDWWRDVGAISNLDKHQFAKLGEDRFTAGAPAAALRHGDTEEVHYQAITVSRLPGAKNRGEGG